MDWVERYQLWENDDTLDDRLREELEKINDAKLLEDMFNRYLEFGTGGMRGKMGPGTNRINRYTIQRVALGLAKYIEHQGSQTMKMGVVLSFDNRQNSALFAELTSRILISHHIKVYLSDEMRPTPQLSFLVRHYNAYAGVMITASHNPKEYNGFKVYGRDGGQITLETANELMSILDNITDELSIQSLSFTECKKSTLYHEISKEADEAYLEQLESVVQSPSMIQEAGSSIDIIYTPLHGTGAKLIMGSFSKFGYKNVQLIKEQADGNPLFKTVKSPNPEDPAAFELAMTYANSYHADLVMATDPDGDRLGVVLKGEYDSYLNGNQIGILLLDYLILSKKNKSIDLTKFFLCKTIVTSDLGKVIAKSHGVETRETLTGFKFIGEQIEFSEEKKDKIFLFGYEESFGYLISPFVRDKDAIQAALLFAELTLYWKQQGKSVQVRLEEIYQKYGYYKEELTNLFFEGTKGDDSMNQLLDSLRKSPLREIGNCKVLRIEDYLNRTSYDLEHNSKTPLKLPKSNVLKFILENEAWICIRPSGTEPKCKIYYSVNSSSMELSEKLLRQIKIDFEQHIIS